MAQRNSNPPTDQPHELIKIQPCVYVSHVNSTWPSV